MRTSGVSSCSTRRATAIPTSSQRESLGREISRDHAPGPFERRHPLPHDPGCARSHRHRRGGRPAAFAGGLGRILLPLLGIENPVLRSRGPRNGGPRHDPLALGQGVRASRRRGGKAPPLRAAGVALPPRPQVSRFGKRLALIAAGGLLARVLLVLWIPTQPVSDFRDYFQRAVALRETGSYSPAPERPDAPYPPAFPLFLLLALSLPGA